jgi:hypothetical protein
LYGNTKVSEKPIAQTAGCHIAEDYNIKIAAVRKSDVTCLKFTNSGLSYGRVSIVSGFDTHEIILNRTDFLTLYSTLVAICTSYRILKTPHFAQRLYLYVSHDL